MAAGSEAGILVERRGAVACITLSRPTVGNSIDLPLAQALLDAAVACDEDDAIRCVLLTGDGRFFCAGGDVAAFAAKGDDLPAYLKEITAALHAAIVRFATMDKPLVTAVNGPAAGAGVSLAILGDIALAAPEAHFTLAYTAIGLSPDGGSTWLLPRLIGFRRTQEIALTNRRIKADEAAAIGLVTCVSADLVAEAWSVAETLAHGATAALGTTRRLLHRSWGASLEDQLDAESDAIAANSTTHDGKEGIAAFLAKRPPHFLGE